MSAPEVAFVLDAVDDNLTGGGNAGAGYFGAGHDDLEDLPVERIDRDDSDILERGIHRASDDLNRSVYVGAGLATRTTSPIGTEYDHDLQTAVGVRIEAAHHSEWGKVDPSGDNGVPFDEIVQGVRAAILQEREFPSPERGNTEYTHLALANDQDRSADYADYYRYDFDVLFEGFETLP